MAAEGEPQHARAGAERQPPRPAGARNGGGAAGAGATIQKPDDGLAGGEGAVLPAGAVEAIPGPELVVAAEFRDMDRARPMQVILHAEIDDQAGPIVIVATRKKAARPFGAQRTANPKRRAR